MRPWPSRATPERVGGRVPKASNAQQLGAPRVGDARDTKTWVAR